MLAVVGELEPGDKLRVAEHCGHALARVEVVDGEGLVSAGRCQVDTRPVQDDLDQGAVVPVAPLEGLDVLAVADSINSDLAILARRQDVFVIVLKNKEKFEIHTARCSCGCSGSRRSPCRRGWSCRRCGCRG